MNIIDAQQALGFLVSQTSHIEREVYEIAYPDIQYQSLIPVDTSANEWAKSVTYYSMDKVGQAQWFNHAAKDVPIADAERSQHEQGIAMAAIGYRYTLEELGQALMIPGMNLSNDKAAAARRAYEEFIDRVALQGDALKGWRGLFNAQGVTAAPVANGAGSASPLWSVKGGDDMVADVNALLTGVHVESQTVEMADTVLLPISRYLAAANRRMGDTQMTALQFIQQNNSYTAMTGRPLTIRGVRGLETAGAGGTARMVAYRRDPQVVKMHLPMPHRFLPVWQTGPIIFDVPGIFRFGGVEVRRPGGMRYGDGI